MNAILAALLLAQAQQPCGPTGQVEKRIVEQYGESIVGAGVVADGSFMFVTANSETGSFTILRRKDGLTCILMAGKGFATLETVKKGLDL